VSLADDLVKELWSLSQELESLKRWKKQHEGTIEERDVLVAKLLQAEDQIEELRSRPAPALASAQRSETASTSTLKPVPPPAPATNLKPAPLPAPATDLKPVPSSTPVTNLKPAPLPVSSDLAVSESPEEPKSEESTLKEAPSSATEEPPDEAEQEASLDELLALADAPLPEDITEVATEEPVPVPAVELVVDEGGQPPSTGTLEAEPEAAVVSLVLDDGEVPQLETFEEPVLLQIFAYLDALEIVNLAQVNIALYSRVDFLFGISEEDAPAPVPMEIATPTAAVPTPPLGSPQATIVQLPPASQPQKKAPPQPQKKQAPAPPSGGIISLFQTSRPQQQQASAAGANLKKAPPSSSGTVTASTTTIRKSMLLSA
jgi:hypothetical protein